MGCEIPGDAKKDYSQTNVLENFKVIRGEYKFDT